jgi:hypothetical protein
MSSQQSGFPRDPKSESSFHELPQQSRVSMSSHKKACFLLTPTIGSGFLQWAPTTGYILSSHIRAVLRWAPTTKQGFRELPQQSKVSVSSHRKAGFQFRFYCSLNTIPCDRVRSQQNLLHQVVTSTVQCTHSHNQILKVIKVNKLNKEI